MAKGDFLWCDLSTINVENTKGFYAGLFGWAFHDIAQPDGSPYHIGSTANGEGAALFQMPEKFQKMGLPSFWMSYIAVDDIQGAVDKASALGGKVEVGPIAFGDDASIALIRDPLGAGFTIYQGGDLQPRSASAPHGHMAWNALYVSDAQAVISFYEAIFDWRISAHPSQAGLFQVRNASGNEISAIHQLDKTIRGKFQFWGVHFAVADLSAAKAQVLKSGGEILYEGSGDGDPALLARDPDGAAFFMEQSKGGRTQSAPQTTSTPGSFKWKTALGLAVIWVAVVMEFNWVWGVLFIMWTIPALRTGQTYFVEPLRRADNALLYWLVVGTWIVLSLYLILFDLGVFIGAGS